MKSKPRFIALVVSSIDGRISLAAHSRPDWASPEDQIFFRQMLSKADAVVVGGNTYAASKGLLRKKTVYLFSRNARSGQHAKNVTIVNPKNVHLRSLFKNHRQIFILGGNRVYQTMLDAGLLHDLYVTIEPLVFGRGKPMFEGGKVMAQMVLKSIRRLNTKGALLIHYCSNSK